MPKLPQRLVVIVGKRLNKERLSAMEWSYLYETGTAGYETVCLPMSPSGPRHAGALATAESWDVSVASGASLQEHSRYRGLTRGWLSRHVKGCRSQGHR